MTRALVWDECGPRGTRCSRAPRAACVPQGPPWRRSGKTTRKRLCRGGDRSANAALWMIATSASHDPPLWGRVPRVSVDPPTVRPQDQRARIPCGGRGDVLLGVGRLPSPTNASVASPFETAANPIPPDDAGPFDGVHAASQSSIERKAPLTSEAGADDASRDARATPASCPSSRPSRSRATVYSSRMPTPNRSGSSAFRLHVTPASSSSGSGCDSIPGTTPRKTLLEGHTSRHVPDEARRRRRF
jgi:hypothetical protein